jgi:hypothetical protein
MTPALDTLLSDWKNGQSDAKELRTVTILPSKSNPTKLEIILKMSVRVIDMAQSETVSVSRKIQTQAQSTGQDTADQTALKECIALIKADFSKKCQAAFERLSRFHDKDSYNERSPY